MNKPSPKILVVDDSATSRAMLEKQLARLGCLVVSAEDGATALAALSAQRYDLVLLDCYMPDMNGYEVARRVRASENDEDRGYTPLIGISAEADAAHVQLCLDSGMDGILGKPLPLQEFKQLLALWCDHEAESVVAMPALTSGATVDLDALFLETSLQDLAQMRAAYACVDIEGGKRMAHRMKGAALTMRRSAIVEQLERIEAASVGVDNIDRSAIETAMNTLEAVLKAASR